MNFIEKIRKTPLHISQKMILRWMTIAMVWGISGLSGAENSTLDNVYQEQQSKLEAAIARLNAQREAIQKEQLPLAKSLSEKKQEVEQLRERLVDLQTIQDRDQVALQALKKKVSEGQKEYDYITNKLFHEFTSEFQALLSIGEKESYGEQIRALHLMSEEGKDSEKNELTETLALVRSSLDRVKGLIGGKAYSGKALNPEGKLVDGKFIQVGPYLYFSAGSQNNSGVVQESLGLRPQVRSVGKSGDQHIVEFSQEEGRLLPVDPTLGNALQIAGTKEGILEHLRKGGVWVIPIVGFAILATIAAIIKMIQIFSIRHSDPLVAHDLAKLLRAGKQSEAAALVNRQPEPTREMLFKAVEHIQEPIELVEEAMYESLLTIQPRLERFLNLIAITASVGPLLGLLGTVTGIIKTFKLMYIFGAGDPRPLISGISEALITTELGLAMAIPALVIHALLSRKSVGIMARLEKLSIALINGLSRKSLVAE